MATTGDRAVTSLPPAAALDLWLDPARWPTFMDGWGRVDRIHDRWPEPGATVVWQSRPGGRGTVTLKVIELEPPSRVVIQVYDDKLGGRETFTAEPDSDGSFVRVDLDYKLNQGGPFMAAADLIFIRRSLRDSIRRTLERFAVEAKEEAGLSPSS